MFRRVEETLEPDARYPADLERLGYFINKVGQIKMIKAPEKDYVYHTTNNARHNEVLREAMQVCQRDGVSKRLSALHLDKLYFPTLGVAKPNGPHIPILAPPAEVLKTRKRVIMVVSDTIQDLGILAYRSLQRELGLNGGSIVNFAKEAVRRSKTPNERDSIFEDGVGVGNEKDAPGLIVVNTGQLLYSHKFNRTMTLRSWSALPRKSIAHDMVKIHEVENRVEGHGTPREHIETVFKGIILNPDFVASDAELYVIGIENGAENLLGVLDIDFEKYGSKITAMAIIQAPMTGPPVTNPSLKAFLHQRTRQWRYNGTASDPQICTELPSTYQPEPNPSLTSPIADPAKHISWLEAASIEPLNTLTNIARHLTLAAPSVPAPPPANPASEADQFLDYDPPCPTFAAGDDCTGECILTQQPVQHAILSFFEAAARNPSTYSNPPLTMAAVASIPHPTPMDPLALDPSAPSTLPPEMEITPVQRDVQNARRQLDDLHRCLAAIPLDDPNLVQGRARLESKIEVKEKLVKELAIRALASGGLAKGEELDRRMEWEPRKEGPKIRFAGAMVDSELVKGAGLFDVAEEELGKMEELRGE